MAVDPRNDLATLDRWVQESENRIGELQEEMEAEESFLEGLQAKRKFVLAKLGITQSATTTTSTTATTSTTPAPNAQSWPRPVTQPVPPPDHASVPERIEHILKQRGRAMSTTEIVEALEQQGVTTTSPKGLLPNVLSALSRRKDLFERTDRGVYGLLTSA